MTNIGEFGGRREGVKSDCPKDTFGMFQCFGVQVVKCLGVMGVEGVDCAGCRRLQVFGFSVLGVQGVGSLLRNVNCAL